MMMMCPSSRARLPGEELCPHQAPRSQAGAEPLCLGLLICITGIKAKDESTSVEDYFN